MQIYKKFFFACVAVTIFFSQNANADVRILNIGESKTILIDGLITPSDYRSFVEKAAIVQKQDPI